MAFAACSDFEEINIDPKAVNSSDARPYWALNKAIIADQQNPNDAERVFVLYWADIARQDGESGGRAVGRSNDEWAGCLYSLTNNCITSCNNAIKLVEENVESLTGHEAKIYQNVKAFARIWRVYLMTEFVDSFGSYTTDFESISPEYKSVQECYNFMFTELASAIGDIVDEAASSDLEVKGDPAYSLDPEKWKNFGISMWMRIAMRLSEVDPSTAKTQFEMAIAKGEGIRTNAGNFGVAENNGWNDLSGVMSRTWDWQSLSMTMANLTTGLGGDVRTALKDPNHRLYKTSPDVEAVYGPYIKDEQKYIGVSLAYDGEATCEVNTDSPTIGYYFDGIPEHLDPRALVYFTLPTDYVNRVETGYCTFPKWTLESTLVPMKAKDGKPDESSHKIDVTFAYNGLPCGHSWDDLLNSKSALYSCSSYNYGQTYPALAERYRNSGETRIFFGAWETYFLLAEAAVRGWNAGITAEQAYNAGIKASLEYVGMDQCYDEYINSTTYNRVGTSVKFTHTEEPGVISVNFVDKISEFSESESMIYKYPVASETLYGKALNDQMCKILTQKYIANCPWLPLENWSDHRRTGLPFWEIPVGSTEYPFLDGWTTSAYRGGQKVGYYAQRMNYPAKFNNANPEQYKNALSLMGMTTESTVTPLWWAKQK